MLDVGWKQLYSKLHVQPKYSQLLVPGTSRTPTKTRMKPSIRLGSRSHFNVNYWVLILHLQFSVTVPVAFALKVY